MSRNPSGLPLTQRRYVPTLICPLPLIDMKLSRHSLKMSGCPQGSLRIGHSTRESVTYKAVLVRPAHRFIRPLPRRLLSHVLSPSLCRPPALLCKHPIRSGDRPRAAESGTSARMRHWLIRARDTATSLDGGRSTAVDAGRLPRMHRCLDNCVTYTVGRSGGQCGIHCQNKSRHSRGHRPQLSNQPHEMTIT